MSNLICFFRYLLRFREIFAGFHLARRTIIIGCLASIAFYFASSASAQTIVNGGFESGLSSWTTTGSFYDFNNSARSHRGSQYAYFGVAANGTTALTNASGSIYQSISIPSGASSASLTYWVWIVSDEGTATAYDFLYVDVLNSSGGLISTVSTNSNRDKSGSFSSTTPTYQQRRISLSAYAGSTIRIRFRGSVDGSFNTLFRLDDVNVTAVTVTSPNGGENWSADTTKTITWTILGNANNLNYFKIALSTDNGANYSTDLTPNGITDPSARSFNWTIPSSLSTTQARIRVRPIDIDEYILSEDASDANFTVSPPATIPTVQTRPVSSVGANSATLNGRVVSDGGSTIIERRIEWTKVSGNWGTGTSGVDYGFFTDATTPFIVSGNDFSLSLVGFAANTAYKYRVWAKNSVDWSDPFLVNAVTFTTDYAAPTISAVTPNSGSTTGGNIVTIDGTNLESASSVTFGGTEATTIAYHPTTGELQPTVPAHAAGTVSVTVTTPGGSVTLINGYTYTASPVTPSNFQVSYSCANNRITVSWTDTSNETSYVLSRRFAGNPAVESTLAANSTSYSENSVTVGSQYCYKIKAINAVGASDFTAEICITPTVPAVPVARISLDNNGPLPGQAVNFSGTQSTGSDLDYLWDFDHNGVTSTDATVAHTFPISDSARTYRVRLTVTDECGQQHYRIASVTVSGQSLGSAPASSKAADPVNLATGNYIYEHIDLTYPSRGFPPLFKRFYNSKDTLSSGTPLGFGWTHNYNLKLVNNITNLIVSFGDGHQETYLPDGPNNYKGELGVYSFITNSGPFFTLIAKDQMIYNFDDQQRLSTIVDKNGNTLSLHFDGVGNLTNIIDTASREIRLEYNSTNCLVRIIDPLGRTNSFGYDAATNLVTATDPNGGVTRYEYDANHQMEGAYDPRNNKFVSNVYDDRRVVTTQKDALLFETFFVYDFDANITTVSNNLGQISYHFHDSKLRVTNIIDSLGFTNSFAYDENNNRTKVVDKNGNETVYTYDERGNVISKTDALINQTTIVYDALNNPTYRTNALDGVTSFGYDDKGNLTFTTNEIGAVSVAIYDTFGQPHILTDANNNSSTNTFDDYGNLVEIRDALGYTNRFIHDIVGRKLAQIDANNHTNSFIYDNNDNVLFAINALNQTNSFLYDSNNNLVVSLDARGNGVTNGYDAKDRLTIVQNAYGSGTNEFDSLDRKIKVTDARGGQSRFGYDSEGQLLFATNAANEVTAYTYDPNGNQITIRNNLGQTATNYFDSLNRLVQSVDPLNHTNRVVYDPLGRQVQTIDAKGRTNALGFDSAGRLLSVTNALGTVEQTVSSFGYDPMGNRLTAIDPNGNVTTNVLDQLNRVVEVQEPRGTYQIGYDGAGNKVMQVDANGQTNRYFFDAANRLEQIQYPSGTPVSFGYDEAGNRTNMTDNLGMSSWKYDKLNRLTNSIDCFGKSVGFVLDVSGNRTALIYPGNKVVSYEFDLNNRMISVSNWLGQVTSYDYNAVGSLLTVTNGNGSKVFYGYDDASRLNALTNLTSADGIISSYNLDLDAVGNTLASIQTDPLAPLWQSQTVAYSYTNGNTLTSAGSENYSHDANGNMTSKGASLLFYDFENRLTRLETTSLTNLFSYDGMGHRMEITSNAVTRRFVLDVAGSLTQVLAETDASGDITGYYIYGLGLVSKVTASGDSSFYHFDQRGNTVALSDNDGAVTDKYAYDPFGVILNREGDTANIFLFLGQYGIVDDGNGLSYIRARYYLASIGRFISKDPLTGKDSDGQSLNRYIYALNNPIRFIDISGFAAQEGGGSPLILFCQSDLPHDGLLETKGSWLDKLQLTLDIAGLVPFFGEVADGANAIIYFSRGDKINGWLSVGALAPVGGQLATAGKFANKATKTINPDLVKFSQDSISSSFKNGGTIDDLAVGLRNGTVKPNNVPAIRLVEKNGELFTLDNRRLEAFRRAGIEIPFQMATPGEVAASLWKFTTKNNGDLIRIRGQ